MQREGCSEYMSTTVEVTDADFQSTVLDSEFPVLVDFWAEWCGPCKMVAPVVEELAQDYDGKVAFTKLDVDANPQTPQKYGIRGIPTLIVFKGGAEVGRIVGLRPKADIKVQVDLALAG